MKEVSIFFGATVQIAEEDMFNVLTFELKLANISMPRFVSGKSIHAH